jgi:hypothetical protein
MWNTHNTLGKRDEKGSGFKISRLYQVLREFDRRKVFELLQETIIYEEINASCVICGLVGQ